MANPTLPHPIWAAVLSPNRAVEVRAWLKPASNRELAKVLRGPHGETMLHWAALADEGLILELVAVGLDLQATDQEGRTPLDWLFERLWMTHVENVGNLTALNLRKLRMQTDDLALVLWRLGARRGGIHDFDERLLAGRCGLWKLLETWADMEGLPQAWTQREAGDSVLHAMASSPDEKGRDHLLALWAQKGRSVDVFNNAGQTPLGVAVEHRLALATQNPVKINAVAACDDWIGALISAGADPNVEQNGVPSPASLPLLRGASAVLADALEAAMASQQAKPDGTALPA